MLSRVIATCLKANLFDSVIVSTEDVEVAQIASMSGAKVANRPEHLAGDFSGTTDVLKNFLEASGSTIDDDCWVYLTYATNYATADLFAGFVKTSEASSRPFTVSVGENPHAVERLMHLNSNGELEMINAARHQDRTQDIPKTYFDAGKFYGGRKRDWLKTSSPLLENPEPFLLPSWAAVDLDTWDDWRTAEILFMAETGGHSGDLGS
jgi:N-acylneuraminate cytidylyltransferase